jgi:hypothetical protein
MHTSPKEAKTETLDAAHSRSSFAPVQMPDQAFTFTFADLFPVETQTSSAELNIPRNICVCEKCGKHVLHAEHIVQRYCLLQNEEKAARFA